MTLGNLSITLNDLRSIIVAILDILVIWLLIYYTLRIVRNNSRTTQIFKGIIFLIIINAIAKLIKLKTLQFLLDIFINWGFLAFIIIFQPEIRSLLERMGKSNVFSRITTLTGNEKESLVDNIVNAVMVLSNTQTGALISIEQSHSLEDYIGTGTRMNSDVTAALLTSIFVTTTPLHDGAVIIQGDKIACASAYFPSTNLELPSRYGARHRAAIGISEVTDAVTIVVSEETGEVSITENGSIMHVNRQELRDYLLRVIVGDETEVKATTKRGRTVAEVIKDTNEEKNHSVLSKLAIKKQGVEEDNLDSQETNLTQTQELTEEERFEEANRIAKEADMKFPHRKNKAVPTQVRMTPEEVKAAREESLKQLQRVHEEPQEEKAKVIRNAEDDRQFDTSMLDVSKLAGFENELDKQFQMIELMEEDASKKNIGGEKQ